MTKDTTLSGAYRGNYQDLSAADMKTMISFAPIAVAMYANSAFMNYQGGIFTGCPDYNTSKAAVNHAVVLVGYDSSGNYIVKNSWGTTWGDNGFATVSAAADCAFSYLPREIRGTNKQLTGEKYLFIGAILLFIVMILA